jgi:UDP-glucose 4-epimerase
MDFINVADIARANVLGLASDVTDEVFNVGSGVETSLNELAAALLRVMKSDLQPEYGPENKVNPVSRRLADVSKAAQMLDFRARIGLDQGLEELVAWWRANKDRVK